MANCSLNSVPEAFFFTLHLFTYQYMPLHDRRTGRSAARNCEANGAKATRSAKEEFSKTV